MRTSVGFRRTRQRPTFPQPRGCSIIGPGGLNFRVRDGNGCGPSGMVTGNVVIAVVSGTHAPGPDILPRSTSFMVPVVDVPLSGGHVYQK